MKKILWDLQPNIKPSSGNTVDEREVELYEHLGSRSCLEYPQRYLTWACVNLHTLDRQLGRLHDTEPMNDSCVACSGWVVPGNGSRIYPWFMFWLFGSHSLCWDALIQGRGWGEAQSCLFLMCTVLLTPHVRPYLLRGVDGGWFVGEVGGLQ